MGIRFKFNLTIFLIFVAGFIAAGYLVKGATGVPVRTLAQLATDLAEEASPKKSRSKAKAK